MKYNITPELIQWLSTSSESSDIVGTSKVSVRIIEEKVEKLPQIPQPILVDYRDETILVIDLRGQLKSGNENIIKRMKNFNLSYQLVIRGILKMYYFENPAIFNPIIAPVSDAFTRLLSTMVQTSFQMNVYETEISKTAINIFILFLLTNDMELAIHRQKEKYWVDEIGKILGRTNIETIKDLEELVNKIRGTKIDMVNLFATMLPWQMIISRLEAVDLFTPNNMVAAIFLTQTLQINKRSSFRRIGDKVKNIDTVVNLVHGVEKKTILGGV